ncbi:TlpA family protein disulfide reductase [Mangrovibacterium lignilyticum]|uniref:TlpA family protein disulfide reductase n=1 Tax=Mangrovibacterium lignilyticum TaxID=2668052 RepID=UPI0013D1D67A|nr:TlpA disulfide reductase family protein [Mangrovibacterium lignilyticum]
MRYLSLFVFSLTLLFTACTSTQSPRQLPEATYRAVLQAQDQQEIPFVFRVTSPASLEVYNAGELIQVDEISYENDSVHIQMPVFECWINAKIADDGSLNGYYAKAGSTDTVPFTAVQDSVRFPVTEAPKVDVSGSWEVVFSPDAADGGSLAKGIFEQNNGKVSGTFRTTTGDYRYLEGVVDGNTLKLSTFDGAHAFLFTATVSDSTMNGRFYSRNTWQEPFTARRNDAFELPDAESLTALKEGYDRIEFSFPDEKGNLVSLADRQFRNKVVVVQIMGSWCPNCLDETRFFTEYAKAHPDMPVAFVGLAFEYAKTDSAAFHAISRLKERVGVEYPVLLAQYGTTNKDQAQEKLPMLNHIMSFPTSIYIDKQGKVRRIHTGFDGPATGDKYEAFKQEFDRFISKLAAE